MLTAAEQARYNEKAAQNTAEFRKVWPQNGKGEGRSRSPPNDAAPRGWVVLEATCKGSGQAPGARLIRRIKGFVEAFIDMVGLLQFSKEVPRQGRSTVAHGHAVEQAA